MNMEQNTAHENDRNGINCFRLLRKIANDIKVT